MRSGLFARTIAAVAVILSCLCVFIPTASAAEGYELSLGSVAVTDSAQKSFYFPDAFFSDAGGSQATSLVITIDNLTIQTTPALPAGWSRVSDLENITVRFTGPEIPQEELTEFIRGFVFRPLNLTKTVEVSMVADGNETVGLPSNTAMAYVPSSHAPDGHDHYYAFIPMPGSPHIRDCYNGAKQIIYNGMRGYLATLTYPEESLLLTRTSTVYAFAGGARIYNTNGDDLNDEMVIPTFYTGRDYWYWICGPEAGDHFYDSAQFDADVDVIGFGGEAFPLSPWSYDRGRGPEPNNNGDGEYYLMVNWVSASPLTSGRSWNDAGVTLQEGGYFVEFGGYGENETGSFSALLCDTATTGEMMIYALNFDANGGVLNGYSGAKSVGFDSLALDGQSNPSMEKDLFVRWDAYATVNGRLTRIKRGVEATDSYEALAVLANPEIPENVLGITVRAVWAGIPDTGDPGFVYIWAAVALAALLAIVLVKEKNRYGL